MRGFFKSFLLAALAFAATIAYADEPVAGTPWRISKTTDEMTDEISYFVHSPGSVVHPAEYVSYRPELVVKVTPKGWTKSGGMQYVGDVYLQIETDGLKRGQCEIMTRFDRMQPTSDLWNTSTDRHAAFAPDWKRMVAKLTAATNLTVRYMTTLGSIRTTSFDVSGLTNALHQVKVRHTKSNQRKQ